MLSSSFLRQYTLLQRGLTHARIPVISHEHLFDLDGDRLRDLAGRPGPLHRHRIRPEGLDQEWQILREASISPGKCLAHESLFEKSPHKRASQPPLRGANRPIEQPRALWENIDCAGAENIAELARAP